MDCDSTDLQDIIAAARAGDAQALAKVRSGLNEKVFSPASPHVFEVRDRILSDSLATGPRVRREVFAPLVPFGDDEPLWQGLSTAQAIAGVRACPPLERVLQAKARAHVAALERQLILDSTLEARGRQAIERALQQLAAPGRRLWEHWVHATPAWRHDEFDRIVDDWLDAPIDWAEQRFFAPGWRNMPYAIAAAGALFHTLDPTVRSFLGIRVVHAEVPGFAAYAAGLELPPAEANRLARLLGVKFRFKGAAGG